MRLNLNKDDLKKTLEISINISKTIKGSDCPQFKRIHHCFHHIVLYIKDYIMKEKCKNYLEIGTHYGHSLITNLQSNYKTKYMAIDLFQKWHDGTIDDMKGLVDKNVELFNKNKYDCKVLKGNSKDPKILESVKKYFTDGVDLLFIDGDHTYNGIIGDFELYFPLINSGGYIIFDDFLPLTTNGKNREAPVAVNHIIEKYKDNIKVIGLTKDYFDIYKLKGQTNLNGKNIDFIIIKN